MVDVFVPPEGVGIVVAFVGIMGIDVGSVDPMATPSADAFAMRLIATTCERDCILCCCCSAGMGVPKNGGAAVAAEDNEEEDVAVVLPLVVIRGLIFDTVVVVSTIGGSGGFITKCG